MLITLRDKIVLNMALVAQQAELRTVDAVVEGSNPFTHPKIEFNYSIFL